MLASVERPRIAEERLKPQLKEFGAQPLDHVLDTRARREKSLACREGTSPVNGPEAPFPEQFVKGLLNLLIGKNLLQRLSNRFRVCLYAKQPADFANHPFAEIVSGLF
jgi:hypothetical protein